MTRCEAKYGDNTCKNDSTEAVVSNGSIFELCKNCAKLARRQEKYNRG